MRKKPGPFKIALNWKESLENEAPAEVSSAVPIQRVANDSGQMLQQKPRHVAYSRRMMLRVVQKPTSDDDLPSPERNFDCSNYEQCLALAAALDWESFSCGGCDETINPQLLWRANHVLRKDTAMAQFCNLPLLGPNHKLKNNH